MPNPIAQQFKKVPLTPPPPLPFNPPSRFTYDYKFDDRLTLERLNALLDTAEPGLLTEQETDLFAFIISSRRLAFAWEYYEKGEFKHEYYPDYIVPTIEHTPWRKPPIKVPKALEEPFRQAIIEQEKYGKFEPCTASYRSVLFPILKKSGKLRLILDLQECNRVVIQDAALPPNIEDYAERHLGYVILGLADLFSGFDARIVDVTSRPLFGFHSPCGPKQQRTLPQGYTNSVQEFCRCVNHALEEEIPRYVDPFLDDCSCKGPESRYNDELIHPTSQIRRFVYEYAVTFDRFLARLIAAGLTASGLKTVIATTKLEIVGTIVSFDGWQLKHGLVTKIVNWPIPRNLSELRGFLGTVGCGRKWIKNFSLIAKPLTQLTKKTEDEFHITEEALSAMGKLKDAATNAPVLIKLDYDAASKIKKFVKVHEDGLVILAVDASIYGAGWILFQMRNTEKKPSLFGSCTYNDRETRYSQPKCELYGLFRAFKALRHRIWGIFLLVQYDAKFLREMIHNPELPNAPMTRWIMFLQLFNFDLEHVPKEKHIAADGLSRRRRSSQDSADSDAEEFLDQFLGNSAKRTEQAVSAIFRETFTIIRYPHTNWYTAISATSSEAPLATYHDLDEILDPQSSIIINSSIIQAILSSLLYLRLTTPKFSMLPFVSSLGEPTHLTFGDGQPTKDEVEYREFLVTHNCILDNDCNVGAESPLSHTNDYSHLGREFYYRHFPTEDTHLYQLGDETISVPITHYDWKFGRGFLPQFREDGCLNKIHDSLWNGNPHSHGQRRDSRYNLVHVTEVEFPAYNNEWDPDQTKPYPDFQSLYDPPIDPETGEVYPPLTDRFVLGGHRHKIRDFEYNGMWTHIRQFHINGSLPQPAPYPSYTPKKFVQKAHKYLLFQEQLYTVPHRSGTDLPRLVIETKPERQVRIFKGHLTAGHRGRDATWNLLRIRYFWPNMYMDIDFFARSCYNCQLHAKAKPSIPYSPTWSTTILRHFHLDCIHMPTGVGGFEYIVQATDAATLWDEAKATRDIQARTVASFIWEHLICRFSCIPFFTVDNGVEFKGVAEILYAQYGVTVIFSTAYHPQSNGLSERAHQVIKDGVIKCAGDHLSHWPRYLHAILFSTRTTVGRTTGQTPYYLTYGIHPIFAFDIADSTWQTLDWHNVKTTAELVSIRALQLQRRDEIAEIAAQRAKEQRAKSIADANAKHKFLSFSDFKPGMWVLRHETWLEGQKGNVGHPRWTGPYIVHEVENNGLTVTLKQLDGAILKNKAHISRIKLFYYRPEQQTLTTPFTRHAWLQPYESAIHYQPLNAQGHYERALRGTNHVEPFQFHPSEYPSWAQDSSLIPHNTHTLPPSIMRCEAYHLSFVDPKDIASGLTTSFLPYRPDARPPFSKRNKSNFEVTKDRTLHYLYLNSL